jgi:hypothetical protein
MSWLLLLHSSGALDQRAHDRALRRLQSRMPSKGAVYVIQFGPTVRSMARCFRLVSTGIHVIHEARARSTPKPVVSALRSLVRSLAVTVRTLKDRVDRVCFSGHGSGWVTGAWALRHPFLTLEEINRELLDWFRPPLLLLDTCMGGSMGGLYGLPSYVKIVVASPGLHPYVAIFATHAFASSTTVNSDQLRSVALGISNEWHHEASASDATRCLLVFDLERVKRVAPLVRAAWPSLLFDKRAQLHQKNANLFDLWTAARNLPHLQRALLSCVLNARSALQTPSTSRAHCCSPCKRIRAMSVEVRVPKKWSALYLSSSWARFLNRSARAARHSHSPPRKASAPHATANSGALGLPSNLPKKPRKKVNGTFHKNPSEHLSSMPLRSRVFNLHENSKKRKSRIK